LGIPKLSNYGKYAIIITLFYLLVALVNFRDEKTLIAFGKRLQSLRRSKNFSQEELAHQSGLTLSQIARIETGKINPTLCTMLVISKTLKIKAGELLDFLDNI
jgi:DNA-binding XRE family transcriptional regulator